MMYKYKNKVESRVEQQPMFKVEAALDVITRYPSDKVRLAVQFAVSWSTLFNL